MQFSFSSEKCCFKLFNYALLGNKTKYWLRKCFAVQFSWQNSRNCFSTLSKSCYAWYMILHWFYIAEPHVNAVGVSRGGLLRVWTRFLSLLVSQLSSPVICVCVLCVCVCDQKSVAALCVAGERGVCRTSVSVNNARVSRWNPCVAATAPPTTMTVSCVWPSARNRGR